jgi:hypothetical protein
MKVALARAVILVALLAGAGTAVAGSGLPEKPAGIDWGNVHFSHPAELRVWLTKRGVRYKDWLRRHPGTRYQWTHARRAAVPAVRQSPAVPPVPVAVAVAVAGSGVPRWIYGFVVALLLLAVTPSRLLARIVPGRQPDGLAPARTALAAAALSVALGVLIASSL